AAVLTACRAATTPAGRVPRAAPTPAGRVPRSTHHRRSSAARSGHSRGSSAARSAVYRDPPLQHPTASSGGSDRGFDTPPTASYSTSGCARASGRPEGGTTGVDRGVAQLLFDPQQLVV